MTSYTVTARTPEGGTVYLNVTPDGWLWMQSNPIYHHHGPKLKDVVWAAVTHPHLSDVCVNETEGTHD